MPRNGSGGYTVPQNSWNPAINGMGALPNDWMAILNDMVAAIQASIAADGQTPITGSLNFGNNRLRNVGAPQGQGDGLRFEQMMKGADIPSAATIAFPIEGALFDVTGTTTITGISGSFPGRGVLVRFMDALTLTNGTNLILPGGADITTQAGDFAAFVCLDGTKWQCWLYPARSERLVSSDYFGPTAPSTTWPGMTWADSGTNTLWRRNAADDDWVNEGTIFKRALPEYAIGDVPTVDKGPIYGIGAGPMEWGGTQYEGVTAAIQGSHKNLKGSATGTDAHVAFSADQVVVEAANGTFKTLRAVSLDIDSATVGVNGLDTGTLVASTWYSAWVIWNGTTTAGLLSLSATAPTLPTGYTHKARVGWIRTDATANKRPLSFVQAGRKVRYKIAAGSNVTDYPTMASGLASQWTAVGVAGFVPPSASVICVAPFVSQSGGGGSLAVAPNGSYPASYQRGSSVVYIGSTLTFIFQSTVDLLLESTNIYWGSDTSAGALFAAGWEDNL